MRTIRLLLLGTRSCPKQSNLVVAIRALQAFVAQTSLTGWDQVIAGPCLKLSEHAENVTEMSKIASASLEVPEKKIIKKSFSWKRIKLLGVRWRHSCVYHYMWIVLQQTHRERDVWVSSCNPIVKTGPCAGVGNIKGRKFKQSWDNVQEVSARNIVVDVKLFLNCVFSALGFFIICILWKNQ